MDQRTQLEDSIRRLPWPAGPILLADLRAGGMADSGQLSGELGLNEYAVCVERLRARRILQEAARSPEHATWLDLLDDAGVEVVLRPLTAIEEQVEEEASGDAFDVEKLRAGLLQAVRAEKPQEPARSPALRQPALLVLAAAVLALILVPFFLRGAGGGPSGWEVGLVSTGATAAAFYEELGLPEELRSEALRGESGGEADSERAYEAARVALASRREEALGEQHEEYRTNHFTLVVRAEQRRCVGVVQLDSRGRLTVLYPEEGGSLPWLEAGAIHQLPGAPLRAVEKPLGTAFRLDYSSGFHMPGPADRILLFIATSEKAMESAELAAIVDDPEAPSGASDEVRGWVGRALRARGFDVREVQVRAE